MTVQNTNIVAANNGNYGQWLAQIMLQKKSMEGQHQAFGELLKGLPNPESHLGQHVDVRI